VPRVRDLRRVTSAALCAIVLASTCLVAASEATGKGFIWRVERDGRIGWLVGSLHVLTPEYYPLPDAMEKAFLRSTTLMEEADITQISSPEVLEVLRTKALFPGEETLKTQVSAETYQLAAERVARNGFAMDAFEKMRPWMMTLTLAAAEMKRAGFDPALGVDRHFFDKSSRMGKKFRSLETLAEQLEMFAGLPAPLQEALLRDTLRSLDRDIGQMKTIADAWRAGDAPQIEQLVLGSMRKEPALYDAMIVRRNRAWVPKVEECIDEGHCFVVVGAAHLVGPDGLIAALKQKGYAVAQE
jgi:uncharacterized protein YbaP (TraB family)